MSGGGGARWGGEEGGEYLRSGRALVIGTRVGWLPSCLQDWRLFEV